MGWQEEIDRGGLIEGRRQAKYAATGGGRIAYQKLRKGAGVRVVRDRRVIITIRKGYGLSRHEVTERCCVDGCSAGEQGRQQAEKVE